MTTDAVTSFKEQIKAEILAELADEKARNRQNPIWLRIKNVVNEELADLPRRDRMQVESALSSLLRTMYRLRGVNALTPEHEFAAFMLASQVIGAIKRA